MQVNEAEDEDEVIVLLRRDACSDVTTPADSVPVTPLEDELVDPSLTSVSLPVEDDIVLLLSSS